MDEFFCVGFKIVPRVTNKSIVKELKSRYAPFKTDSTEAPSYAWYFRDKEIAEKAKQGLINCKAADVWLT